MKYPWVSLALVIIWFGSTYIILKSDSVNVSYLLLTTIVGTIAIAIIGFYPPKIKK